jgi:hypothetical protein
MEQDGFQGLFAHWYAYICISSQTKEVDKMMLWENPSLSPCICSISLANIIILNVYKEKCHHQRKPTTVAGSNTPEQFQKLPQHWGTESTLRTRNSQDLIPTPQVKDFCSKITEN